MNILREMELDDSIEYVIRYINEYDVDSLLEKLNYLKYIIPIPDNYEHHDLDNWFDLFDDEEIHWRIPEKTELVHVLELLGMSAMYYKEDQQVYDIYIKYNEDDTISIDESYIDNEIVELNNARKEWEYDIKNVLPTKPYVGNCSKEFCEKIVEKYYNREYQRIQFIDFPPLSFKIPTEKSCITEFSNLLNDKSNSFNTKGYSNIIKYFHKSIVHANVNSSLSPYDGWKHMQQDEEAFKDFYRNRLRCSDWFKGEGKLDYMLRGVVMENTYGIGLSTSRKYQLVTYFKPKLARYIISRYLNDYSTIFDPFSGYSGRMLGALSLNKKYIGQDLCESSVKESNEILGFLREKFQNIEFNCEITQKDSIKEYGEYECLFTCPPYGNIENWPGVKSSNYSCDRWIDICLSHYHCNRYVFVVDDKIEKYVKYVKDTITNTSHFAANKEYVVVIDKDDLKDIHIDIDGDRIESEFGSSYTSFAQNIYNVFNQQLFNDIIDCPVQLTNWVNLIYDKFEQKRPYIRNVQLPEYELKNKDNKILLACSGGLDSIYQIFQLKNMGYDVIVYHMKNVNSYENMQSYKSLSNLISKINVPFIESTLKRSYSGHYAKTWAENPIKNQMMILNMIDWCFKNDVNKICMDGSWEFPIEEVTAGIDVADAPENYEELLNGLKGLVKNLEFIKTQHLPKIEKIKYLDSLGFMNDVYSCLGAGKLNKYNHDKTLKKYPEIELFEHNCGSGCRKCSHHNLLMHYSGYRKFPDKFIDECWNRMSHNGYASRNMLFGDNIPLEKKIQNLYVE